MSTESNFKPDLVRLKTGLSDLHTHPVPTILVVFRLFPRNLKSRADDFKTLQIFCANFVLEYILSIFKELYKLKQHAKSVCFTPDMGKPVLPG